MKRNDDLKEIILQHLKMQNFRQGHRWIFNQQVSIRNSLHLNYDEFKNLMHELQAEGYVTIETNDDREDYILTAKIDEIY